MFEICAESHPEKNKNKKAEILEHIWKIQVDYIYSAAGNLQLYLPMRVVRFACQPQLPFRTIAAAMIYTGESCDDLLQASQTN